ncbi:MAG: glycosyltransferase family 4 protein [Chitinophagales bacterium]|nr:glycosyltransferase family 4 protein [Chitinophagales bacterium]
MKNKGIFYNYQLSTSFIRSDKTSLEERYRVVSFIFNPQQIWSHFWVFFQQAFYLLRYWKQYDVIVSQIAAYHTFLPSLLSQLKLKKHVIILHGTDCNIIPEIHYGNLRKWPLRWFTIKSLKMATLLLPVSERLMDNDSNYLDDTSAIYGLKRNVPNLQVPYKVIHNGLDVTIFKNTYKDRAPKSFVTVALGLEKQRNYLLKGIDLIYAIAKDNPDYTFTIVGSDAIFQQVHTLNNVKIIGKTQAETLVDIYNQHQFYLQLSMSESFGMALCEAMLCGCIPVVSDVGMMPEIVGKSGFVLHHKEVTSLDLLLKEAIASSQEDTERNQEERSASIVTRYALDIRKKALFDTLDPLFSSELLQSHN